MSEIDVEFRASKSGEHVKIEVIADGEVVYQAKPLAKHAVSVTRAAFQVFGHHGWPHLSGSGDNGGDAFQ